MLPMLALVDDAATAEHKIYRAQNAQRSPKVIQSPRLAQQEPRQRDDLGRHNRPTLVVTPAATDLQIAGREAFLSETAAARQRDRRVISRLDVGLQPMQFQGSKRVADDRLEPLAHEALLLLPGEGVVAQVPAA